MIDPIAVASSKLQSIAGILVPMLVFLESDQLAEKDKHWYRFIPHQTISQLINLMKKVRKDWKMDFELRYPWRIRDTLSDINLENREVAFIQMAQKLKK